MNKKQTQDDNGLDALFQSILDACVDVIEDKDATPADMELAEGLRNQVTKHVAHRREKVAA